MRPCVATCAVVIAILTGSVSAQQQTAADLIRQAHEYDNMYNLGPETSQQKALSLYQSALAASPTEKQRLHIIYRMAQLYGSSYQLEKGEKPDFHRAIQLYQQIIDSCPENEPLVFKAMISIGSHYTTLWDFEKGLKWFKKTLEYDTSGLQQQLKDIELKKQELDLRPVRRPSDAIMKARRLESKRLSMRAHSLRQTLELIKVYQQTAVDQVAYCGGLIDPFRAHGELRVIIEEYSGTFIAERAHQRLMENMDSRPELWVPTNDPPIRPNSGLYSGGPAAIGLGEGPNGIEIEPDVEPAAAERRRLAEPDTSKQTPKDKHAARQTRAPPITYLSVPLVAAAAAIFLALAAVVIRRMTSS